MNKGFMLIALAAVTLLAGCTQTTPQASPIPSPSQSPTASPTISPTERPSPSAGCFYQEVQCIKAPCEPILICKSPTPTAKPKATIKEGGSTVNINTNTNGSVQSYSTSNSSTNININSNGTTVKINNKNGKRYAEVNGKEVELDANGCYDYDKDGTKIHTCVNN